jgi:hypothetical protein
LANLGVPGTLTYAAFIAVSLLGGPPDDLLPANVAAIRAAARGACFGLLIAATVSGALIDLGLPFFIFAALACAAGGYALPRQIPAPARLQLSVNAA